MTNSVCIAQQLGRRCPNQGEYIVHEHVRLESGRTRKAQIYPRELCRAICRGLQNQIKMDHTGQFLLMEMNNNGATSRELMNVAKELASKYRIVEEPISDEVEMVWDDVSGAEFDPTQVKRARAEEVEYVRKMGLYNKVPIRQCYEKTGKGPISVRWIDINKGDQNTPNYQVSGARDQYLQKG